MEAKKQRVHFVAIGESMMLNLALALDRKGYTVTGSDVEISESSKSRLEKAGILPNKSWNPDIINSEISALIVGSNTQKDNPELLKAKNTGIKVFSFAEFIYQQSIDKQRIVVTGSHGKTSIASIILYILKFFNRKFDYVAEDQPEGFEYEIQLTENAPVIIIEGDESLTSPIDKSPEFVHYQHHIGLISGVAWDHINAFPTFDEYVKQFELFADKTPKGGTLIYLESDDLATVICRKEREDVQRVEYVAHKNTIENGQTYLLFDNKKVPVQIFGKHNMKNISGAKAICMKIGITEEMFYQAIQSFKGTAGRLEMLEENNEVTIYKDIAGAPSELKATTKAVKHQFPSRKLVAVLELNTFSSLSKDFLHEYRDTFKWADEPIVLFDPGAVANKKLPAITSEDLKNAFGHSNLEVFTDGIKLKDSLLSKSWKNRNLLLMSSGNFADINVKELAKTIVAK